VKAFQKDDALAGRKVMTLKSKPYQNL